MLKITRKIKSRVSMTGLGSSNRGSSIARQMQFAKIVNKINLSNHGLKTIYMIALRNLLVVVHPQSEVFAKFLVWFCWIIFVRFFCLMID